MNKNILKEKKKQIKNLQRNFNLDFIRNATFSVGSDRRTVAGMPKDNWVVIPYLKKKDHSRNINYDFLNVVPMIQALDKWDIPAVVVQTDDLYHECNNSFMSLGKQVSNRTALIRKDIFIEPVQIYESKAIGADGVYLNGDEIPLKQLKKMMEAAIDMALDVFIEVQSNEPVEKIKSLAQTVGLDVFWVRSSPVEEVEEPFYKRVKINEFSNVKDFAAGLILEPGEVATVEEYFSNLNNWMKSRNNNVSISE